MASNNNWRSIRYKQLYGVRDVPTPLSPLPKRLYRQMVLPEDELIPLPRKVIDRPFCDLSKEALIDANRSLVPLRVELKLLGYHKRTNLLAYYYSPITTKAKVEIKNPWYNFILVWSISDFDAEYYWKKCMWCARISEDYYGQEGIYMNLRKRSQRWNSRDKQQSN
jgi:hypothetical protein